MQLKIWAGLWIAICGAALLAAQSTPPAAPADAAAAKPHHAAKALKAQEPQAPVFYDATSLGSPLVLDKNWRVGISSDPAVTSAGFNDSAWVVRNAEPAIEDAEDEDEKADAKPADGTNTALQAKKTGVRYAWFRIHIKLAPNHGPVALLVEMPVTIRTSINLDSLESTPDVYANGRRIVPEGPHGSAPGDYQPISRIYDLNLAPAETSLTLVVRMMYVPFGYGAYTNFFTNNTLQLGNPSDLNERLKLWSDSSLFIRLPDLVYSLLLVVLAVFLFALYFAQKGHSEYLWLALHELVQAPIGFVQMAGHNAWMNSLLCAALVIQLLLISAYFFFEFLAAFLALKRRWYLRLLRYTAPILMVASPAMMLIGHTRSAGLLLAGVGLCTLLWLLGWSIFIFSTLIGATLKRNFEAALLLVPLLLILVGVVEPSIASALGGANRISGISPLTYQAGPIPIRMATVGDFAGILVIVIIIFFRYLRVQRDQERATNELAAAREIQELLIPQEKPATPGFEVDSIYSPASEVGGDFFYVQPTSTEGMLVVIGDVAGKGLKAAMNVSLLMGALRRTEDRSPARILRALNSVLTGTESFTTCQAIWFGANGEMVIANAGHLPPYLNSQEIALPGGLPLGVLAEVAYEEARFYLHPGDRVLLLSDGVVEARQPNGELFGFDRVRYLSQQSAFYLADAAKSFGQQDDITVLTVRRQAQAAA